MHTAKIARSIASDVCIYIIIYIIMCMYIYQIPVRMYGIYIYKYMDSLFDGHHSGTPRS